ncbi:hypothetical protein C8R44DRAFT_990879 [Mycena epipterygia]|nr:hypothetical protein C8R44DRAFT_990879 [Mycena epipterygia]
MFLSGVYPSNFTDYYNTAGYQAETVAQLRFEIIVAAVYLWDKMLSFRNDTLGFTTDPMEVSWVGLDQGASRRLLNPRTTCGGARFSPFDLYTLDPGPPILQTDTFRARTSLKLYLVMHCVCSAALDKECSQADDDSDWEDDVDVSSRPIAPLSRPLSPLTEPPLPRPMTPFSISPPGLAGAGSAQEGALFTSPALESRSAT